MDGVFGRVLEGTFTLTGRLGAIWKDYQQSCAQLDVSLLRWEIDLTVFVVLTV